MAYAVPLPVESDSRAHGARPVRPPIVECRRRGLAPRLGRRRESTGHDGAMSARRARRAPVSREKHGPPVAALPRRLPCCCRSVRRSSRASGVPPFSRGTRCRAPCPRAFETGSICPVSRWRSTSPTPFARSRPWHPSARCCSSSVTMPASRYSTPCERCSPRPATVSGGWTRRPTWSGWSRTAWSPPTAPRANTKCRSAASACAAATAETGTRAGCGRRRRCSSRVPTRTRSG